MKYAELWRRYKELGDQAAREDLLRRYVPLVRHLADWLATGLHMGIRSEELEAFGLHGLLEAVDHFEPERGIRFEAYAALRVRGAMLDGVRADSWAPSLRRKQQALDDAFFRLQSKLGREPDDGELARELGISTADLARWQSSVGALAVVSLDEPWAADDEGLTAQELLPDLRASDPAAAVVATEERAALTAAIDGLAERDRLVVTLVYYEGLAMKEVAGILGVSLSRVSQLHSRALLRLRTLMQTAPVGAP